jgi:hypothetical protein
VTSNAFEEEILSDLKSQLGDLLLLLARNFKPYGFQETVFANTD